MIDNLLVRIHFIIEMIWWTGLTLWDSTLGSRAITKKKKKGVAP